MPTSSTNDSLPAWLKGDLPQEPGSEPPEAEPAPHPGDASDIPAEIRADAPIEALPAEHEPPAAPAGAGSDPSAVGEAQVLEAMRAVMGTSRSEAAEVRARHEAKAAHAPAEAQALEAAVDPDQSGEPDLATAAALEPEAVSADGAAMLQAAPEPAPDTPEAGAPQSPAADPNAAAGATVPLRVSAPMTGDSAQASDAAEAQPVPGTSQLSAEATQPAVPAESAAPAQGKRRGRKGKPVAEPPAVAVTEVVDRAPDAVPVTEFRPAGGTEPVPTVVLSLEAQLESLLFVADGAVPVGRLAEALEVSPREVEAALAGLGESYRERGLSLQRFRDRVQLTTAPSAAEKVERFLGLAAATPLSRAALETLAIIAYQQPVTRPQIEAIRGVNSDSVIKNLLSKGLVEEMGRAEGPGRPVLYSTTSEFMQHFGLASLNDLPPLSLPEPAKAPPPAEEVLKG